jgi:hypothetical protein
MPWATIAGVGLQLASSVLGSGAHDRALKSMGQMTRKNVTLERLQTQQELRNLDQIATEVVGQAKLSLASSGFAGGSVDQASIIGSMEGAFADQREWVKMAGATREDIAKLSSQIAKDGLKTQRDQGFMSAAAGAINVAGQVNNWWSGS